VKTLAEVRAEIDALDEALLPLLERRLRIADAVAAAKRAEGLPIDDPVREQAILDAVSAKVAPDCAESVRTVFRTLFAESKARQGR